MKQEPKQYDDDDGRVICDMNVAGMRRRKDVARRETSAAQSVPQAEQLTHSGAWLYTWYSVLAGLSIVLVFSLVLVLFVLFCTEVWLR